MGKPKGHGKGGKAKGMPWWKRKKESSKEGSPVEKSEKVVEKVFKNQKTTSTSTAVSLSPSTTASPPVVQKQFTPTLRTTSRYRVSTKYGKSQMATKILKWLQKFSNLKFFSFLGFGV